MFKSRIIVVVCFLCIPLAAIVWRLVEIQIFHSRQYSAESKKQAEQRILVFAKRGDVVDRKGRVLSSSIGSQIKLSAAMLAAADDPAATSGIADSMTGNVTLRRMYPFGEACGAVLGYVGKDGEGLGGVEFSFNKELKGENGWAIVRRDGRNKRFSSMNLPKKDPVSGSNVQLTIDIDIQKIAENVIRQSVTTLEAKGGMCIVMEPTTGKILAMVNEPSFNPNMPGRYSLDQRLNKCIAYTFEPGSTFKAITASCALQENLKKETDTIDGNHGVYEIYNEKIRDEKPYGKLSFSEALCYSSNVCFAKIAKEIGNEKLYKYTRDFGLGEKTGITLPGEESGTVHPIEKWSGRTLVTMAIGQEVSVTLLQMVMMFSAIANNGVLCEPRIYDHVTTSTGTMTSETRVKPIRRIISQESAMHLKNMLGEVVKKGTGVKAAIPGIAICGKTGTAQKIDKETGSYSKIRGWSSFIGFTPPQNPQLLCAVVIDEPLHGEMGGAAAAPAFAKIVSQIISHPQLEFAERFLGKTTIKDTNHTANSFMSIPQLCNMAVDRAETLLVREKIPYERVGIGATVDYQSPGAGSILSQGAKLLLYTSKQDTASYKTGVITMPDCKGKDIRDAVNCLNVRGLVPYIIGSGNVHRQVPDVGAIMKRAEVCTLFCSFVNAIKK